MTKATSAIDKNVWSDLVSPWDEPVPAKVCEAVGCLECRNVGYLGRQGIYEILPMTENLHRQIQADPDIEFIEIVVQKFFAVSTIFLSQIDHDTGLASVDGFLQIFRQIEKAEFEPGWQADRLFERSIIERIKFAKLLKVVLNLGRCGPGSKDKSE